MAILKCDLLNGEKRQFGGGQESTFGQKVDPSCRSPTKDEHPKSFTKVSSILHMSDREQPETW